MAKEGSARAGLEGTWVVGYLEGHVTAETVTRLRAEVEEHIRQKPPEVLLIDCIGVTGFDPDVRTPGVPWLQHLKGAGIKRLYAIAPNGLVRMMGSAIAVAAGLPLRFVKDREEIAAALRA